MNIAQVLHNQRPSFSFEFFPPKTQEASENLYNAISELNTLQPSYVSVTYGAGGGTRELTHDIVVKLTKESGLTVVSHLTTVGHTQEEIGQILEKYDSSGVQNIMALRGDPPKGQSEFVAFEGGFAYASELVAYIKKHYPAMGIGVAGFPEGHPGCPNRLLEIEYLKRKVDAGADYICTQLFFDNKDFYDFQERCDLAGINVPIVAGIMPIVARKGMKRMAELALGARFPAKLLRAMERAKDDDYAKEVGIHWATEQVSDLVDNGVRGVHFYTLNKSDATLRIYKSLGIENSAELVKG